MSGRRLTAAVKEVAEPVVAVHINRELHRFEAYQGGAVAGFVAYEMDDGQFRFTLTQLSRDFRNIRFGEALIRAVLNDAQRRRIEVLPFCPLMRYFIATHHGYLPLVPVDRRHRFGLPRPDELNRSRPAPDVPSLIPASPIG
ncbi:N-acetyltransferase [Arthrobacter monumenti]